jgi:hypothetical protein
VQTSFFEALNSVGSSFERSQVLLAVVQQPRLSDDVLESVLQAAGATSGSFEVSQVLQATASRHRLAGKNRELYVSIAGRLGQFEEGQALSALVKGETR